MTDDPILRIPIRVDYRIVDGELTKIGAEYAEIPASMFAEFIIKGFGLPVNLADQTAQEVTYGNQTLQPQAPTPDANRKV